MEKEVMYKFLVKAAIPVNEWGKETETDRIRDAIWRAHRDTLTGRFQLEKYRKLTYGEKKHRVTDKLYEKIIDCIKSGDALSSMPLINFLHTEFPEVEFGARQKLVNMSLKYLIILNAFEFKKPIAIDEANCHCPIDSIILGKLKKQHTPWTKIQRQEYNEVQQEIYDDPSFDKKSMGNVVFDFENW